MLHGVGLHSAAIVSNRSSIIESDLWTQRKSLLITTNTIESIEDCLMSMVYAVYILNFTF